MWKVTLFNGTVVKELMGTYQYWYKYQPSFKHLLTQETPQSCVTTCENYDYKLNDEFCYKQLCSLCEIDP